MTEGQGVQLPQPLLRGTVSARCIEDVMRPREAQFETMFEPGREHLGHYYLAPFQRPAVWTESQAARLIESVFLGISIGSIVVSDCGEAIITHGPEGRTERFAPTADLVIDGQQRMRALARYMANDLTVFRGTPGEHRFSDLARPQRRRFLGATIGFVTLEPLPMEELARLYDLLNFGGTPHEESQRASTQATR